MFNRIKHAGDFVLNSGVRSHYDYDYASLSDTMNAAYCNELNRKLEKWQNQHGKFNVVIGVETEGIRIGYTLAQLMGVPFHILPHQQTEMAQLDIPSYPADSHWLIVDDIVNTGLGMVRAIEFLGIEEKLESFTFACMIRRNPTNLDYDHLKHEPHWEQFHVPQELYDFVSKRLVYLYAEPE